MNKITKVVAMLSTALAVTTIVATAMAFPQAAFAQQASVGVGSTNGGTVGGATAATPFGTSSAVSGGPTNTQCLSMLTPATAISLCDSE